MGRVFAEEKYVFFVFALICFQAKQVCLYKIVLVLLT